MMTEKRFECDENKVIDNWTNGVTECKNSNEAYLLCNLLNELSEENEQLKKEYHKLKHGHSLLYDVCLDAECERDSLKKDVESLENENEQLKFQNSNLMKEVAEYSRKAKELDNENKELKAKVDDKEVAVEVECEKLMQKVFDLIDEKIDELEKKYKFGQEVAKCCPMHNIRHSINVLKELKKELIE